MTGYTKLFSSIIGSTIWRESDKTRIVWITMLAMADQCGVVEASVPGLADFARVSTPECELALSVLLAPDPYSRTKEHEGRRIEIVDGGWRLLNHAKYRSKMSADDRREYQRKYMERYRAKGLDLTRNGKHVVNKSKQMLGRLGQADAEAEAKAVRGNRNPLAALQDWQLSKDFERVTRQLNAELDLNPRDLELIRSCRQELNELKAEKRRRAPAARPAVTPTPQPKPEPAKAIQEGNGQFGGVDAIKWAEHVAAAKRVVEGPGGG